MVNAQQWINNKFPTKWSKENAKVLLIGKEYASEPDPIATGEREFAFPQMSFLEGELDLNEFSNLEELVICSQKITSLSVDKLGDKLFRLWLKSNLELKNLHLADYPNFLFLDFHLVSSAQLKIITPQLIKLKQENQSLCKQLEIYQQQYEAKQEHLPK
ncbi:MAG: hypothetical protein LBR43_01590 [Spiroplasmataceae bacterium]|nr:hypothetical protein [Spiroplasmataceae bacterium]